MKQAYTLNMAANTHRAYKKDLGRLKELTRIKSGGWADDEDHGPDDGPVSWFHIRSLAGNPSMEGYHAKLQYADGSLQFAFDFAFGARMGISPNSGESQNGGSRAEHQP